MEKIKNFFINYWKHIVIAVLFISLEFLVASLLYKSDTKGKETLIKDLQKENVILIKEKKSLIDSMEYFHLQALIQNNRDTIYVNKINYIKTKTNEEINSVYSLLPDSNYKLFTKFSEEFIAGLDSSN